MLGFMTDIKFTRVERLLLANQYKILERLDPDEADYYTRHRIALERGYEGDYEEVAGVIAKETLSPKFPGFDVNEEAFYLQYARWFTD